MSSAATITFDADVVGISAKDWKAFCAEHNIQHSPNTIGGNVYYLNGDWGSVELTFDRERLSVSTFHGGQAMPDVARLALLAWRRWGGDLSADPEIRARIGS
jgi:hypothetical protein